MRHSSLLVVLALVTGSRTPAVRIEPPPLWREWYAATEACSGLHRDFDSIVWLVREPEYRAGGVVTVGNFAPPNSLWVAASEQNEKVIRHEMMHYLIGRAGHPSPPFGFCVTRYGKE